MDNWVTKVITYRTFHQLPPFWGNRAANNPDYQPPREDRTWRGCYTEWLTSWLELSDRLARGLDPQVKDEALTDTLLVADREDLEAVS